MHYTVIRHYPSRILSMDTYNLFHVCCYCPIACVCVDFYKTRFYLFLIASFAVAEPIVLVHFNMENESIDLLVGASGSDF